MDLINLKGKRVLVGVTGSIAIYKACELVRLFVKSGAETYVVMSEAATKFISPLTFEALTRNRVLTTQSEDWSSKCNHIDYAQKCDAFVIAPATANSINKLAKGIADTLVLQCALAYNKTLVIAPAANSKMIENHYTSGSLKMLSVNDVEVVSPTTKLLACGDEGNGALAEPKDIYYATVKAILKDPFWSDRRVVVTGGGTREAIDNVRYIGNRSSGKMANALATALYLQGADVCLITTIKNNNLPKDIYTIDVEDAQEMLEYTIDAVRVAKKGKMSKASMNSTESIHLIQKTPYLFMAAAVADYKPKFPQEGKLKKSMLGESWQLELTQTKDILKNINKDGLITVGFKAEKDPKSAYDNAKRALEEKNLDAICLNILNKSNDFGSNHNKVTCITKNDSIELALKPKIDLSFDILNVAKQLESNE